jgi:hypothetical protein
MIVFYVIHSLILSEVYVANFLNSDVYIYHLMAGAINNCLLACLFCGRRTGIACHKDSIRQHVSI